MDNDNKFNGWTNYETWNVALWLDNDEVNQEYRQEFLEQAKNTPKNPVWTIEETVKFTLADLIQNFVEENNPISDRASMFVDLLQSAIDNVNWNEIAENIISEDN